MSKTDDFYLEQEEPNKGCFLVLREIILNQDVNISETVKYGLPCFCYKKRVFCYLWKDKKTQEPYILMTDGKLIDHPSLEQGTRKRMKVMSINPNEDIDLECVQEILQLGLDLYRDGIVNVKQR